MDVGKAKTETELLPRGAPGGLVIGEPAAPGFDRLPGVEVRCPGACWVVAHTRPRQEKALGESLVGLSVPCFVPLVGRVRYYGHRRRDAELPLFPSYVFLHATKEQTYQAMRTDRIVQILPVTDQAGLEHELVQLDRALAAGAALDPYPRLGVGTRAVVIAGPFKGVEGTVDGRLAPNRLVLNVSLLGRATSVEIDPSLLEPLA